MEGIPGLPAVAVGGPSFFWSVLFGLIGTVYFMYGKKQEKFVPMFAGIVLGVYPYFIKNTFLMVLAGLALMAAPFFMGE